MMRTISLFCFSIFIFSCNTDSPAAVVKAADRIEVIDIETKFSHTDTTGYIVEGFKELLSQNKQEINCSPQGYLVFKKGEKKLYQIGWYKDASDCTFLIAESNGKKMGYPLNNNTLMYLGIYFQKLKMEHERTVSK